MDIIERNDINLSFSGGYNKPVNSKFKNATLESYKGKFNSRNKYEFTGPYQKMLFYISSCYKTTTTPKQVLSKPVFENFNILKELHSQYQAWDIKSTDYFTFNFMLTSYDKNEIFIALHFPMWYQDQYRSTAISDMVYEIITDPNSKVYEDIAYKIYRSGIGDLNYKKVENIKIFVVRDRSALFEIAYYKYMGDLTPNSSLNSIDIEYLDKIKDNEDLSIYFRKENLNPSKIILEKNGIEVPILENINGQWVFYKHNYDKNRDKLTEGCNKK